MLAIALVTSRRLTSKDSDSYESVPINLSSLLIEMGYLPVAVSNQIATKEDLLQLVNLLKPSLLVFSGGENIGEYSERDFIEKHLLNFASENPDLKVWGICRGMQFIAMYLGGEIVSIDNHIAVSHPVFEDGKLLGEVNSYHSFQVVNLPNSIEATSLAGDGSIESFRHSVLPWFACMWHPERMAMKVWMREKIKRELFR
jgi:gamma-glutamyl-gamma-aminobutyrate hydrolase PuuD